MKTFANRGMSARIFEGILQAGVCTRACFFPCRASHGGGGGRFCCNVQLEQWRDVVIMPLAMLRLYFSSTER